MVFRIILIIFFIFPSVGKSEIIYDKNEITITDIEINIFKKIYEDNIGISLSRNNALKEIVKAKNTINFLLKYNPEFMKILDDNITSEFGQKIINDQVFFNFIRFLKIRNEFISEYFQSRLDIQDLKIIFSSYNDLKLPMSLDGCITIEKLYEVREDNYFISNFFGYIKNENKKLQTKIDEKIYDVCINTEKFKLIESSIIKYIENETQREFDKFVYEKIN